MKFNSQNHRGSRRQPVHPDLSGLTSAATSLAPRALQLDSGLHPSPVARHSERGIALVLTLILLSVTLVMALAFLAISGRERGSVTTQTDTATTRLATEAGLAAAEAQIAANILSTTNPYSFGLVVSTNFINPNGFDPANLDPFDNINYDHLLNSPTPLSQSQFLTLLTNLWFSPRVPVLLTNLVTHKVENRFYLDLNRNGVDDPNGSVLETNSAGFPTGNTNFEVGDPEWIGVLERPDQPYGPNNPFIARYAFIALPAGNSLDLNAIHNQAHRGLPSLPVNSTVNPPAGASASHDDIFIRNEGVGSWEINLAAFLADLNTNQWGKVIGTPANGNTTFYYYQNLPYINYGYAFDDARALLAYRYNNDFNNLQLVPSLLGANGTTAFENDNIDGFSYGSPLMTGFDLPGENDPALIVKGAPWVGADSTNHFSSLPADLFGAIQNPYAPKLGFTDRLLAAGTNYVGGNIPTYDRYTFYRMLSQLGTDTAPESGKMNLNYDNLDPGANGVVSATNFMAWQPITFFTNAADRLLKAYTAQWFQGNPSRSYINSAGNWVYVAPSTYLASYYGITNIYYHLDSFRNHTPPLTTPAVSA
jgi:hypothetical protein